MQHWWNDTDRGKQVLEKNTCFMATLPTTNLTWSDPGSNPSLRGESPASVGLNHGMTSKTEMNLHYLERTSSYLGVNTYCDQSRKLRGEIMAVYCQNHGTHECTVPLLLPGAELSLIAESFCLLNDLLLPFLSILDASCPIFDRHLANVLFDVILPSVLGSSF